MNTPFHPHPIFLLDNIDSFTYNLVDELRSLGYPLTVYRNTVSVSSIVDKLEHASSLGAMPVVILSPGPGTPAQAGCMPALLDAICGTFPVLGICLGHQAIIEHCGGEIIRAQHVMHGKASAMTHSGDGSVAGLVNPLPIARYHSLMGHALPPSLSVLAHVGEVPMAVYQAQKRMLGFQFHPESILTVQGSQLLKQSIDFLTQGVSNHE